MIYLEKKRKSTIQLEYRKMYIRRKIQITVLLNQKIIYS